MKATINPNKAQPLAWLKSLYTVSTKNMPTRRNDLDWLRVLAFTLLIFFHVGMFYVSNWGWHIKSEYQSQFLQNIMLTVEPWRMPLLWLISGIAIHFVLAKVSILRFITLRSFRILLPLLFGILVIVPPQLYIEMTYNGVIDLSYGKFLNEFFSKGSPIFANYQSGIWPHIDVNHLWFLRSLWQYSLVILLLLPILNNTTVDKMLTWIFNQHVVVAILIATLPVFIIEANWPADTARYPIGFCFLLYGYLIGWNVEFWHKLKNKFLNLMICTFVCYLIFILFYNFVWLEVAKGHEFTNIVLLSGTFCYSLLRVLGVLCLLAFAFSHLNHPSKKLQYFNAAVYPFYILHQTFIIIFGFHLSKLQLGPVIEPLLLLILTISACFLSYELIKRVILLRPFFGLKSNLNTHNRSQYLLLNLGYVIGFILIIPLAWEILI